jgi:tripartite-type tricarboxylate transporter receptor subunit TctC
MNRRCAAALLLCALAASANAEDTYPSKPVRVIVPFAPGSSTDVLARLLGERLSRKLAQPFVIENRPGAGGVIGTAVGAKAPPDGYTIVMAGSGPFGINPAIYSKLPYDPLKDFSTIVNLVSTPQVLVTSASGTYKTLQEFMAAARSSGKSVDFASIGPGSTSHMAGQYFRSVAKIPMNHIPFKGNADAQMQVIGNTVPVMFDALPGVQTLIASGKLRALAVAAKKRSPFAPDIPTFEEQGVAGLEVTGWIGLVAPAGTPAGVLDRLNQEINAVMAQPDFVERLAQVAFTPVGGSRTEFETYIRREIAQWSRIAKESNIQMD